MSLHLCFWHSTVLDSPSVCVPRAGVCLSPSLQVVLVLSATLWTPVLIREVYMRRQALVSGCARGCGVTHHGFCVWDCSLFCVSDLLHSHWSPPGTFFQPLLSARHPCCTTVIPLRTCPLSEIAGICKYPGFSASAGQRLCTFP